MREKPANFRATYFLFISCLSLFLPPLCVSKQLKLSYGGARRLKKAIYFERDYPSWNRAE